MTLSASEPGADACINEWTELKFLCYYQSGLRFVFREFLCVNRWLQIFPSCATREPERSRYFALADAHWESTQLGDSYMEKQFFSDKTQDLIGGEENVGPLWKQKFEDPIFENKPSKYCPFCSLPWKERHCIGFQPSIHMKLGFLKHISGHQLDSPLVRNEMHNRTTRYQNRLQLSQILLACANSKAALQVTREQLDIWGRRIPVRQLKLLQLWSSTFSQTSTLFPRISVSKRVWGIWGSMSLDPRVPYLTWFLYYVVIYFVEQDLAMK